MNSASNDEMFQYFNFKQFLCHSLLYYLNGNVTVMNDNGTRKMDILCHFF